ncbi:hypothetical protein B0A48_02394 [Cryoendolithus antarcticus]|uniref:Peptide hydrolase n=1 Tax=Cryoendolithus antarcticus TaxID=1507870 RepID=A0A1V8TNI6_9PEZI|nr:hypothetical protein B0A48_02394 [Cryoendolithus antarcticus]
MLLKQLLLLPCALRTAIAYTTLTDLTLESLALNSNDFSVSNKDGLLAPILIPRVPGTEGIAKVQEHFASFFRKELPKWKFTFQNSTSTTPLSHGKEVPFRNIIVTRDPPWIENEGDVSRLVLVAHYDSKIDPPGFIGAIDSAVPCAALMHTARAIDAALTAKWTAMETEGIGSGGFDGFEEHKGVQILLLDGEEAFVNWQGTDNTYGARSLAEEWDSTVNPALSTFRTPLESMELFVLLDLLGSRDNQQIPSYFKMTHWAYQRIAQVEGRLRGAGHLKAKRDQPLFYESDKKETDEWLGGRVGDDHEPFMARGVEILHIIPGRFPDVWHTKNDDAEHLDMDTVEDWAMITTAFAAEYMDLEGFMQAGAPLKKAAQPRDEL